MNPRDTIKFNLEKELNQFKELRAQNICSIRSQETLVNLLKKEYGQLSTKLNKTVDSTSRETALNILRKVSNELWHARKNLEESKNRKAGIVVHLRFLNMLYNKTVPYQKETTIKS